MSLHDVGEETTAQKREKGDEGISTVQVPIAGLWWG
jgi:hypothetical protein